MSSAKLAWHGSAGTAVVGGVQACPLVVGPVTGMVVVAAAAVVVGPVTGMVVVTVAAVEVVAAGAEVEAAGDVAAPLVVDAASVELKEH